MNQFEEAIKEYIAMHFEDSKIEIKHNPQNNEYLCTMQDKANINYQFNLTKDALSGDKQEMIDQLERYNLANVLTDFEGMQISVTNSGCIFF